MKMVEKRFRSSSLVHLHPVNSCLTMTLIQLR